MRHDDHAVEVRRDRTDHVEEPLLPELVEPVELVDRQQAGLGAALRRAPKRYPAIVVIPQVPVGTQWTGAQADLALAALDQVLGEYRVDVNRVYLTGLSMGGHGTWYLAYRHPERFAAAAPKAARAPPISTNADCMPGSTRATRPQ